MLGRWINAETVSNTSIISYEVIIANILHRKFCAQEGKATIGHPFPHQLDIKIQITYNHTIHVSISTKPDVIRSKHIVQLTGFGTYSLTRTW